MSLINQMLKDLEERRAPQLEEHADTIKGVAWTTPAGDGKKRRYVIATVAISLFCTGIAAGSYYHLNSKTLSHNVTVTETSSASSGGAEQTAKPQTRAGRENPEMNAVPVLSEPGKEIDQLKKVTAVHKQTDAHKILAALMASGKLAEDRAKPKSPAKTRQKPSPVIIAAAENKAEVEKNVTLEKKLRPLGDSKRAEIAYQQAYELIARRQHQAGEQQLRQVLKLKPGHSRARETLAVLYLQQHRVIEAGELLRQGMAIAPSHVAYREIYARVLMAQNQLPQAIAMLNEQVPELARQPNYHALLAGLYQKNQQHEQAAAKYLQLVKTRPQQPQWWLGMAIALEKMGKATEAITAYKKARELKLPARLSKYVDSRLQALNASYETNP